MTNQNTTGGNSSNGQQGQQAGGKDLNTKGGQNNKSLNKKGGDVEGNITAQRGGQQNTENDAAE